jgi:hypothetical protein
VVVDVLWKVEKRAVVRLEVPLRKSVPFIVNPSEAP